MSLLCSGKLYQVHDMLIFFVIFFLFHSAYSNPRTTLHRHTLANRASEYQHQRKPVSEEDPSAIMASFECSVCLETLSVKTDSNAPQPTSIAGDMICDACLYEHIPQLFLDAINFEHKYPPRLGPTRLEAANFAEILIKRFGYRFMRRYQSREREYAADVRVYCNHQLADDIPVGETCPEIEQLDLTPNQIDKRTAEGLPLFRCGGFVSCRTHEPGTILWCPKCYISIYIYIYMKNLWSL